MDLLFSLVASLWFWVAFILFWLVVYAVNEDEFWPPVVGLVAGFLVLHWWSTVPVLEYVKTNYVTLLTYTLYYFGIGVVWSFVKWYFFLVGEKQKYSTVRKEFLDANKLKDLTECNSDQWNAWAFKLKSYNFPPKASQNKNRITTWMMYWTFSVVGTFFGTFLRDLVDAIYRMFGGLYDRLSKAVFKDLGDEFIPKG